MRYDNEHKELLEPYCTAVDTLTQGNCILYPDELTQRELALFLGNHFRFNTSVKADYAYGKFKDALIVSGDWLPTDTGRQILKDSIAKLPLTGQMRKVFYRKYSNPSNLKKLIRAGSDESLQAIRSKYPGMENLSNDEMIDIFIGTPDKRREVFGRLFNEIFKFKNLLPYSYLFPD